MNRKGIFSDSLLSTGGLATQGLARFIYTLLIGRIAGPEILANTVTLLSLTVYLSLALPASLGIAASRFLPVASLASPALTQLTRWFWISASALALFAFPVAMWLTHEVASSLAASLLVWTYSLYLFRRGILLGESRVPLAAAAETVAAVASVILLYFVVHREFDWANLLPLSLGYILFALIAKPGTIKSPISITERAELRRFVAATTVGALSTGGLLPITVLFVRAFDTIQQAGEFAAALTLATPASLVAQALNQVFIPHFARLNSNPRLAWRSNVRLLVLTIAMFVTIFGAMIYFAPTIITLIYGERYLGGATAMRVLLLVVCFISMTSAPSAYLVATGRQMIFAYIWATSLMGAIVVMALLTHLGMLGTLIGLSIGGIGGSLAVILWSMLPPKVRA